MITSPQPQKYWALATPPRIRGHILIGHGPGVCVTQAHPSSTCPLKSHLCLSLPICSNTLGSFWTSCHFPACSPPPVPLRCWLGLECLHSLSEPPHGCASKRQPLWPPRPRSTWYGPHGTTTPAKMPVAGGLHGPTSLPPVFVPAESTGMTVPPSRASGETVAQAHTATAGL